MNAVIFDMDGVIIDSEPIHIELEKKLMRQLGFELTEEEMCRFIGTTNTSMWTILKEECRLEQTVEELVELSVTAKLAHIKEIEVGPIEGIYQLLDHLVDAGYTMAVASSSPEDYIHTVLEKFGIKDRFQAIVSGETVAKSKPAPDVFLKAAELIGVAPYACTVIEDSEHGVSGAKAAGMQCIAYNNVNSRNQSYEKADTVVNRIDDIIRRRLL